MAQTWPGLEVLSMLQTIWLWFLVSISLFCFSIYLKPVEGARDLRALVMGILSLVYAALHLRVTYSLLFASLPHSAILFRMVRGIVGGMFPTILFSMGSRQGARIMLIISGVLFVGLPLALMIHLHGVAPAVVLRSMFTVPNFYILESYPVGIATTAIVLLLRPDLKNIQSTSDDRELTSEARIANDGSET
jgi:hypothetical protein